MTPKQIKKLCNDARVFVRENPSLHEALAAFQSAIQKHQAAKPATEDPNAVENLVWSMKLGFLQNARDQLLAQKNNPPSRPTSSGSEVANQQQPGGSDGGSGGSDPLASESNPLTAGSNPPGPTNEPAIPPDIEYDDVKDNLLGPAIDLQEHLSDRSPFAKLTLRQQQAILKLLEDYRTEHVVQLLLEPPPIGMDFRTSESALNRFRRKCQNPPIPRDIHAESKTRASAALQSTSADGETFEEAAERLLQVRLLKAAEDEKSTPDEIETLVSSLARLRKERERRANKEAQT
jgi:hypothetical protein